MSPRRSTLRTCALYYARAMISLNEYRDFRRGYIEALYDGRTPPEIPEGWHSIEPGTLLPPEVITPTEKMPQIRPSRRKLYFALCVGVVVVIGVAILYFMTPI